MPVDSAMSDPDFSAPAAPATPSWQRDWLLLALAFGALYFFRLGSYPLSDPDEGRNAEIAREMLVSGDWVTPRLDGVNYFEKPPLVYWLTAVSEKLFGLNEWAVRAVPALLAIGGVLLTYAAARRLHGRDAGLMSAIVLGTSLLWFAIGHIPLLDMAVSVFMAGALFAFIIGVGEPPGARRRRLFLLLYASMALATLAKGLIGFLVTGAVMFLWLLVFNQWKRLRPLHLLPGVLLFLVIAASWHVLAALRNPTWVHRYFVYEHFERFLTPAASRPGPVHYFVWILIAGLIPWTGFLWPAVRTAVRGGWAKRDDNCVAWYLVTWAAFIFFFFSISKSKLPPYILPIFPALAVLIGAWLARVAGETGGAARMRGGLRVFTFINGLLAVALLAAVLKPGLIIHDPAQALALQAPAFAMAATLLLGGIFVPWLAKIRGARQAIAGVTVTAVFFLAGLEFAAPNIIKPGTKPLALLVKSLAKPGDRVMHYFDIFQGFCFYAERTVECVAGEASVQKLAFSEIEFKEDAAAVARGQLMTEAKFREAWTHSTRVFMVAKKGDVTGPRADGQPALFADPTFHYHLLAENRDYYLFSNQP